MSSARDTTPSSPTSPTRLRQIALVSEDLEKAQEILTKVIGTEVIFVDPGVAKWGLKNFLVAIGGDVIEVVSPKTADTTAGRLLVKRGDGGYMIIMQTLDAAKQRLSVESRELAKVIFGYEHDDVVCVQYHPKGIKDQGGVIPELDSHAPSSTHPDPLNEQFSPWHACGGDYASYSAGMKRCSDLRIVSAVCRLAPGDTDTEAAAQQWEEIFGVTSMNNELIFTNARLHFTEGVDDMPEGLVSITIAVEGEARFTSILNRASEEGLCGDGWINMIGVKWYFELIGEAKSRL